MIAGGVYALAGWHDAGWLHVPWTLNPQTTARPAH